MSQNLPETAGKLIGRRPSGIAPSVKPLSLKTPEERSLKTMIQNRNDKTKLMVFEEVEQENSEYKNQDTTEKSNSEDKMVSSFNHFSSKDIIAISSAFSDIDEKYKGSLKNLTEIEAPTNFQPIAEGGMITCEKNETERKVETGSINSEPLVRLSQAVMSLDSKQESRISINVSVEIDSKKEIIENKSASQSSLGGIASKNDATDVKEGPESEYTDTDAVLSTSRRSSKQI